MVRGNLRRHVHVMLTCGLALTIATIGSLHAQSPSVLEVGKFSAEPEGSIVPTGWKPLTFKKVTRHTQYQVIKDGDRVAIKATSNAASAGLTREIKINAKEYPIVQWSWKVTDVFKKSDVSKKEGDDYPARLYITFEYDAGRVGVLKKVQYEAVRLLYGQYPPLGAINYIWESKAPVGTVQPNPYTDQVIMFVVESGKDKLNRWVTEERNVSEDYKKAFGEDPPPISGVTIMTDTDNTGESATSYYGDIVFKKAAP